MFDIRLMPPKKIIPTKQAPKKAASAKPGLTKTSVGRGHGTTGTGRTTGLKQAAVGSAKKTVPIKGKMATGNNKDIVKSPEKGTLKKHVWTEKDTMARKIQNAYRVYRCKKKLLMLKKKKEEFDTLMEALEREVIVCLYITSNVTL